MQKLLLGMVFLISLCLAACSIVTTSPKIPIEPYAEWGVVPFVNNTETPQGGARATSMVSGLLRATRHGQLKVMQPSASLKKMLTDPNQVLTNRQVRAWASRNNVRYIITGSVNEWHYKVGLDGEPVVSITIRLVDVATNHVLWNSVGSKIGGSRSGLTNVAQELMIKMLKDLFSRCNRTEVGGSM